MTEISDVKNAAIRLRAIYHNQAIEPTPVHDDRKDCADVALEAALIAAGMMLTTQAIAEIASLYEDRKIVVVFEDGQTLEIHV